MSEEQKAQQLSQGEPGEDDMKLTDNSDEQQTKPPNLRLKGFHSTVPQKDKRRGVEILGSETIQEEKSQKERSQEKPKNAMQRAFMKMQEQKKNLRRGAQQNNLRLEQKEEKSWSRQMTSLLDQTSQNQLDQKKRNTTQGYTQFEGHFKKGHESQQKNYAESKDEPFQRKPTIKNKNISPSPGKLVIPDYETDDSQKKVEERPSLPPRLPLEKMRSNSKTRTSMGNIIKNDPQSRNANQNQGNPFIMNQNPFNDAGGIDSKGLRNVALKYNQAIYIYFEGHLKSQFHVHSLAPVSNRVEISKKPQLLASAMNQEDSGQPVQRNIDSFPDWQCAPALKVQGDIFRILPANDHNYAEKVRKIMKSKKKLEPKNQFKYGEYLESLNEEIKFNMDICQNFKNSFVQFGQSVLIMHESSKQFLKISSPSMSDNSFSFKQLHPVFRILCRLKLSPNISEKTVFKVMPSNKLQQESEGKIHEYDQVYIAYAYDKILQKDLYLFSDPDKLEQTQFRKTPRFGTSYKAQNFTNSPNQIPNLYPELVFQEDKKLPLHFGVCPSLSFEHSDNLFRSLNGKVIQIKHVESEMLLSMTIKRRENRLMTMYFGDKNRYALNKLIDHIPNMYQNAGNTVNVHFEARESINTYWKVHTSNIYRDMVYLENAVSKVRLVPMHLQLISRGATRVQDLYFQSPFDSSQFFKFYTESDCSHAPLHNEKMRYNTKNASDDNGMRERHFLWVEYMKFIKTDNRYEFSRFGKMNEEDKGNFFDSFKIVPIDIYKQHCLHFINISLNSIKEFDSYQADNEDSTEYESLLQVLKTMKKFAKNKLPELINVEEEYGVPNKRNQDLLKESFLLDEMVELMDFIWPDEHYMRSDFQFDDSVINSQRDPHKETKMTIAETIFELLDIAGYDNLPIQEYTFFELIPSIQKFFGVGFRKNQDYELFRNLVQNCDKFAEYKEKSKYNVIFQFIKKLFKEKSNEVKANIFQILRHFCINSLGEPNHYHQKLLHDLFFFNRMENLRFTLKFGKTNIFKAQNFEPIIIEGGAKDNKEGMLNRMLSDRPQMKRNDNLEEIKSELKKEKTQTNQTLHLPRMEQASSGGDNSKNTIGAERQGVSFIDHSDKEPLDNFIAKVSRTDDETLGEGEFIIKQIHDMTFDNLTEEFLMNNFESFGGESWSSNHLNKIQLYFFADMCYLMNFDCQCSHFTQKTVSNFIQLLIKGRDTLNVHAKAGLTRVLNTILMNYNDSVRSHPVYLRLYERQEFRSSKVQDIIKNEDVRILIKLSREHFEKIIKNRQESITEYDSEMIRMMSYLISSDLIFSQSFQEGLDFIKDIFNHVAEFQVNAMFLNTQGRRQGYTSLPALGSRRRVNESTLNSDDFLKTFKKVKKILNQNLDSTSQGMIENPIAWKSLNLSKQFVSYVEKSIKKQYDLTSFMKNQSAFRDQEKARQEMVRFYFWLLNLRIDQLISNIINIFHERFEKLLASGELNVDSALLDPSMISVNFINILNKNSEEFLFFEEILNYNSDSKDNNIEDIDSLFSKFIQGYKSQNKMQFFKKIKSESTDGGQIEENEITEEKQSPRHIMKPSNIETEIKSVKEENAQQNSEDNIKTPKKQMTTSLFEETQKTQVAEEMLSESKQTMVEKKLTLSKQETQIPEMAPTLQRKMSSSSINPKQKQLRFLDILIDMFVFATDPQFQQDIIQVMFKCMTIRREFLYHFQRTIVIFRSNIKPTIHQIQEILSKCQLLIQDSTIWEMPKENDQKNMSPPETKTVETLEDSIASPVFTQPVLSKSKSHLHSIKQEYVQKMKEHQKNQSQLFQALAFTKSNKTADAKLAQLDQFMTYLEKISQAFTYSRPKNISKSPTNNQKLKRELSFDDELKLSSHENLNFTLPQVKADLQYGFLALQGHEIIINFMERNKELRQESIRILFFNQKNITSGEVKHESEEQSQNTDRIQYAFKVLLAYKKCFEILIKFIHNNHTNKQVLLNYIDSLLLFNSEYYMQSKMENEVNLYDFDLLNHIIQNNQQIKHMSTILTPKIHSLVLYLHKIVEFPKKAYIFAPKILKVYSNIIANSDNSKINDLIVDIIMREEEFFQIQGLIVGKKCRVAFEIIPEHFYIIDKFLKGISGILRNQSIRMVKKKFYTIFNRIDNLQSYFDHLKHLLELNIEKINNKYKEAELQSQQKLNEQLLDNIEENKDRKDQSIEDEIIEVGKKFLMIETYYIHIFYQLFFDVKGNQKQVSDKVEEMKDFLDLREKDIDILEPHIPIFEIEEWPQYFEFEAAIDMCRKFISKFASKSFLESQTYLSQQSPDPRKKSPIVQHTLDQFHSTVSKQRFLQNFQERLLTTEGDESSRRASLLQSLEPHDTDTQQKPQIASKFNKKKHTKEEILEKKKESIFLSFKWNVIHDESLKGELKKEMNVFAEIMLQKLKKADHHSSEADAQKYHAFYTKLIEYAHKHISKDTYQDINLLIQLLSNFIDLTNAQQQYKGEGFEAKTQIQEKLNSVGAVSLLLELMCSDQSEIIDEIFPQLLLFANRILDGAQNNVQQVFTEYLTKNESSINLFQRCYQLIEKEIQILQKLNSDQQDGNFNFKRSITMRDGTHFLMKNKKALDSYSKQYGGIFGQERPTKNYNKVINAQKQILKFLKNLCENHNTKLQLLVGNQQNSMKNFDMVSLTVNYLHSLISNISLSKRNYTNAQHCCIALAEYVQGPCFVNQNLIKDANFYHLAVTILQLKPTLLQDVKPKKKNRKFSEKNYSMQSTANMNMPSNQPNKGIRKNIGQGAKSQMSQFNLFEEEQNENQNKQNDDQNEQKYGSFQLSNFMIQKLKLNCTIILLSLLEQRPSDDPLLLSMKRSIPLEVIKQNIIYEYFLFCKNYNKFLSRENFFRHVLTESDDKVTEELIIEVGFNLYFLLKRWSENKRTNDSQLEEFKKLMSENDVEENAIVGTFKQLFEFVQYVTQSFKQLIKQMQKGCKNKKDRLHKRSKIEAFMKSPNALLSALKFFKRNSGQIEVLINGSIEQVYFPYMPYCTYLNEEDKRDFYNNLPTDRDKEKIDALINDSIDLIRRMKIEYHFKKFFINSPLVGAFVYYTELWKTFSFYTIVILNMMNLYSFTAVNGNDRMDAPRLFHTLSVETTQSLYSFFGILQIIFALCIDLTIISKRVVYHYELIFQKEDKKTQENEDSLATGSASPQNQMTTETNQVSIEEQKKAENAQNKSGQNVQNNLIEEPIQVRGYDKKNLCRMGMSYLLSALSDFILLYYGGYLIFSFCGYMFHPFFYCYHMVDIIIRNPYLKNVLKAIYRPRYELLNTLILFLCMEYIFTIISYISFYDDFGQNECTSLSQCFLVIIDQNFKADGGLGSYMEKSYPKDMTGGDQISYSRFIFDNFFNVIMVILVVEIISGIIIDTFGALREEHNKITDSIENKCMICGKNRDQIEREYQDSIEEEAAGDEGKVIDEKAFDTHKNEKHNIYDYIFFLAYLVEKPELEYTGLESFVFEKYNEHNNTWFPIYKIGGDKGSKSQAHSGGESNGDEENDGNESGSSQESGDENNEEQENTKIIRGRTNNMAQYKQIMEQISMMNAKFEQLTERIGVALEDDFNEDSDEQIGEMSRYRKLRKYKTNKMGTMTGNVADKPSPRQANTQREPARGSNNLFQKHRTKILAINALARKSTK